MTNVFSRMYSNVSAAIEYRRAQRDVWKNEDYQTAINRISGMRSPLPPLLRLRVEMLHAFALLAMRKEREAYEQYANIVSSAERLKDRLSQDDKNYIQSHVSEIALAICEKYSLPRKKFSLNFEKIDLKQVSRRLKHDYPMPSHPEWSNSK